MKERTPDEEKIRHSHLKSRQMLFAQFALEPPNSPVLKGLIDRAVLDRARDELKKQQEYVQSLEERKKTELAGIQGEQYIHAFDNYARILSKYLLEKWRQQDRNPEYTGRQVEIITDLKLTNLSKCRRTGIPRQR